MRSEFADTITALATPEGVGAIGIIRMSGPEAITICNRFFKGADLTIKEGHTAHFGTIRNGDTIVDEVVVTLFRAPRSYTAEDTVEVSCHGSPYILKEVMRLFNSAGARPAKPGEFTQRAFMSGRMDLAQAEAVADLIHSETEAGHKAAMNQLRGGFSTQIKQLRLELIHFASLVELELDFSEEDVEFADRDKLRKLIVGLHTTVSALADSFHAGNAIKKGIPTVIAGKANAGKSTLLNALLNEERAIVSEIAGTTRDFVEDTVTVNGVLFRFTDTAGLRQTTDVVESIGIRRTLEKIDTAGILLYVFDAGAIHTSQDWEAVTEEITPIRAKGIPYLLIANKADLMSNDVYTKVINEPDMIAVSGKHPDSITLIKDRLAGMVKDRHYRGENNVVTNLRHYDALQKTAEALEQVLTALDTGIPGDLMAMDIKNALYHLGELTGEISTDDLLDNIFRNFCIGK